SAALPYKIFPFVIWGALRFGQRGAVTVSCLAATIAILGAVQGWGPFSVGTPHENLVALQLFNAVVAISALLLGAAIAERDGAERRGASDFARLQRSEGRLRLGLDADRRKDEFLAMLAHELRNPLAPLSTAVHLLQREGADRTQVVQMAERQVRHLARLVDDLLDVSRITQGKVTLRKELVLLSTVVEQAVEMVRTSIDARGHAFTVSLPGDPVRLDADPARLAQVVGNLLSNAAKYTPRCGSIWLTAEREGDGIAIRIRDTGIGIAADFLPSVFDLFAQGDASLDRARGGLGIGLTVVRNLVGIHGRPAETRTAGLA